MPINTARNIHLGEVKNMVLGASSEKSAPQLSSHGEKDKMTEQPEIYATDAVAPAMSHSEAPYSFNLKAYDSSGFDVMFTIRDEDGTRFMTRVNRLREWLIEAGYTPHRGAVPSVSPASNGNGHATDPNATACEYHGAMKRSTKVAGGWFCSSKMADGSYCKETAQDILA